MTFIMSVSEGLNKNSHSKKVLEKLMKTLFELTNSLADAIWESTQRKVTNPCIYWTGDGFEFGSQLSPFEELVCENPDYPCDKYEDALAWAVSLRYDFIPQEEVLDVCCYCNATLFKHPLHVADPRVLSEENWKTLAALHADGCRWIESKAFLA